MDIGERFAWLGELNSAQRVAVTHGEGPLLVVAGAGTGKTRTLAYRVAYLVATGVDPDRIMLLTFTRRAAQDMLARAASIVSRRGLTLRHVWGGTFHSVAHRLLRTHAKAVGLSPEFTVLDETDAAELMGLLRGELGLARGARRFPRKATCLNIYSRCVNAELPVSEVIEHHYPWCGGWEDELKKLFGHYEQRKQDRRVLDFDDLLVYWAELASHPRLGARLGQRFDHILVDEYQDTNVVQARILQGIRGKNGNIMVVGDDAQSIYSFRAAEVRNMLDFPVQFPDTTVITLEENYRSRAPILETTNRLVAQARERYTKDLWSVRGNGPRPRLITCADEHAQDDYVIGRVLDQLEQGTPLRNQAVLFRASHLSASLEVELGRRGIPYHKYGGLRFLEAAHVKDLLAILRIAENSHDELAWLRVLKLMEGVGDATAAAALQHLAAASHDPRSISSFNGPSSAREDLKNLGELMRDLLATDQPPAAQLSRVRVYYEPLLERLYEQPEARARDLASLEQIASGFTSRQRFLVELQLDPPSSTSDLAGPPRQDDDWLVLSTIHSAKGGEWDVVYLVHAADGFLPSDMACKSTEELEEELRVAYVALTRARDHLYVLWPLRYYYRRVAPSYRHGFAQLCRFINSEVAESMDQEGYGIDPDELSELHSAAEQADLSARMRSRWD
ncbi:MAG: ATP-dependent helicase [Candidatus Bipolaricaulota bacterium]